MEFSQLVVSLNRLAENGSAALKRLEAGATAIGRRQLEALKVEARESLVRGLTELALRVAVDNEPKPESHDAEAAAAKNHPA